MKKNDEIIRRSFGLREEIKPRLEESYHSPLIQEIKASGYVWKSGRVTFRLAEEFGFCYGVERAIDYAYQTCAKFPDRRIFITNEIIHNPQVNSKLRDMGVHFLSGPYAGTFTVEDIRKEDVVIVPAFGATLEELARFQEKGCVLVETTCGSVMSVWKRVESYAREGFTSVIHGKYDHEETLATASRATRWPGGKFLVVRDKAQAQKVCDFLNGRLNSQAFMQEFDRAMSQGFDPAKDLQKIGCANQTTMLSGESLEISGMLERAMIEIYGEAKAHENFRQFDTICSATQERQDAVKKLVNQGIALMIVVGGYNSSNTGHLVEIALQKCPAYHVNDARCIVSRDSIRHKKVLGQGIVETGHWLPEGEISIGVTAGASTPNLVIEQVIRRIAEIA